MTYGSFAGVIICLIGHPFDTLKTRLQMQRQPVLELLKKTAQQEGILALYKGLSSPLSTIPLLNALVFGSYSITKAFLSSNQEQFGLSEYQVIFFSSILCGLVNSPLVCPIELFKIKLQIQGTHKIYLSNSDIFTKIYRVSGFRSIFQGLQTTLWREGISYPSQFLTYEFMLNTFRRRGGELGTKDYLLAGGCAGTAAWVSSYGIDVIKTKI